VIDGVLIFLIRMFLWEGADWIDLAENSDMWWAVVNKLLTFQEGLCSMKLVVHAKLLDKQWSKGLSFVIWECMLKS
jgi:hypothetical protein